MPLSHNPRMEKGVAQNQSSSSSLPTEPAILILYSAKLAHRWQQGRKGSYPPSAPNSILTGLYNMQYSSSSPLQLTLSLLCIWEGLTPCRWTSGIKEYGGCYVRWSREYFITEQERRNRDISQKKKKNSDGKVNNLLCWFAFLSCPLFKFKMYVQRQKDIQPSY